MTYEEIKAAKLLHHDRQVLLTYLHGVLEYAIRTEQKTLITISNQALSKLERTQMYLSTPKVNHGNYGNWNFES